MIPEFMLDLEILFHHTSIEVSSIVTGDLNINCLKKTLASKQLSDLMEYYCFHPCIRAYAIQHIDKEEF